MATIEIRTRDVGLTGWMPDQASPQHTFLIYTDDNGNQEILRGGAYTDNEKEEFGRNKLDTSNINNDSDIIMIHDNYEPGSIDWGEDGQLIHSETIAQGQGAAISDVWESMKNEAQRINDEGYPYSLLFQNCNTAMAHMIRAGSKVYDYFIWDGITSSYTPGINLWMGIDLPDDNGNEWWTHGVNLKFNPETLEQLQEKAEDLRQAVENGVNAVGEWAENARNILNDH